MSTEQKKEKKMKKTKVPKVKKQKASKKINNSFITIKQKFAQLVRFVSNKFEQMFSNNKFTLIVTFFIALLLVQNIQSLGGVTLTKNISSIVKDTEVTTDYDRDKFVVEGLPPTVNLILFGDDAAIQSTKNTNSYSVVIDLKGYGAGTHLVDVAVENLPNNVRAQTDPNRIQVNIYTKEFKQFEIRPEIISSNAIEGLSMENPNLAESTITLKGATKDLNRVSFVRALIDGKAINASLTDKNPQVFTGRAAVIAYDDAGAKIENVSVDTGGIEYTVDLVAPTGKPISTLKPVLVGNLPEGKAIRSFTLDSDAVTINGADEEVNKVTSLDVKFDLKNITNDTSIEGEVIIPDGVKLASVSPKRITAKIEFGDAVVRTINVTNVITVNADKEKYNYEIPEALNLMLEVTGTEETLATFDENSVRVEVDVANLGEGSQQVALSVNGPSIYRYKFSQPNIKINITRR